MSDFRNIRLPPFKSIGQKSCLTEVRLCKYGRHLRRLPWRHRSTARADRFLAFAQLSRYFNLTAGRSAQPNANFQQRDFDSKQRIGHVIKSNRPAGSGHVTAFVVSATHGLCAAMSYSTSSSLLLSRWLIFSRAKSFIQRWRTERDISGLCVRWAAFISQLPLERVRV